ncbi:MAG: tRNA lysidine(34) synthetase TilS [Betaproteobacteria bacterium]|nr:tRNA lysidine(34) synthetase TilS [Betaproteobacteria bacterium]
MAGTRSRPSADPVAAAVHAALAPRLAHGDRLWVALSGGLDSVALLHALTRTPWPFKLHLGALHINHGLSPNAGDWEIFCADLCRAWNVPLRAERVVVGRRSGRGLEAAAREVRHAVFGAAECDWLALAHNADDQAETVLHRLVRGAGVLGASGMRAQRRSQSASQRGPMLVRPLLALSRAQLRLYAEEHHLRWVEDESNADVAFARNFLRREVLPMLERRFPGCRATLGRAAELFDEAQGLLDDLADIDLQAAAGAPGELRLDVLRSLPSARVHNALRRFLRNHGVAPPERARLEETVRQVLTSAPDRDTSWTLEGAVLRRYRGRLILDRLAAQAPDRRAVWSGEAELPWGQGRVRFVEATGGGVGRVLLATDGSVTLRSRQGGEHLRLRANRPCRPLKKLLQEAAIPPWTRRAMPLLWSGERLVWVPGVGVAAQFRCAAGEPGLEVRWDP